MDNFFFRILLKRTNREMHKVEFHNKFHKRLSKNKDDFSFFTTPLYIQIYFLKKLMVIAVLCGKTISCYDFSIARSDIFESTTLVKIIDLHLNLHETLILSLQISILPSPYNIRDRFRQPQLFCGLQDNCCVRKNSVLHES